MCGLSAGSLCWFERGALRLPRRGRDRRRHGPAALLERRALRRRAERRAAYRAAIADGMPPGYAAGDGAALHFVGTELARVVSSRPKARAYRVAPEGDESPRPSSPSRLARRAARPSLPLPPERARSPTILAMGGGGFTAGDGRPRARPLGPRRSRSAPSPRICLLPTAAATPSDQIRRFYESFGDRLCEPSHISLFRLGRKPVPLREHLLGAGRDLRRRRLDGQPARHLARPGPRRDPARRWQRGTVLAGLSAGAMCWFQCGMTTSLRRPAPAPGLGFLPGLDLGAPRHRARPPARVPRRGRHGRAPVGLGGRRRRRACCSAAPCSPTSVVAPRPGARAYAVTAHGERAAPGRPLDHGAGAARHGARRRRAAARCTVAAGHRARLTARPQESVAS